MKTKIEVLIFLTKGPYIFTFHIKKGHLILHLMTFFLYIIYLKWNQAKRNTFYDTYKKHILEGFTIYIYTKNCNKLFIKNKNVVQPDISGIESRV